MTEENKSVEELSPEETHDIVQEIHTQFKEGGEYYNGKDIKWPEITAERLIIAGMDYAISNYKANCIWVEDQDEPIVAAVTSDKYKFVPYEIAVKKFLQFLSSFEVWGKPSMNIHIIGDGEKISVTAKYLEHIEKIKGKAKVGDTISPTVGFKHSVDLQWPYSVESGAIQLACTNGMVSSKINQTVRKKHRAALDIDEMNATLSQSAEALPEQLAVWNHWADTNLNKVQTEELIDASFGSRHKEQILTLPETQSQETVEQWMNNDQVNVFDLYSVMTQFVTHDLESDLVRVKQANSVADLFHKEFPLK